MAVINICFYQILANVYSLDVWDKEINPSCLSWILFELIVELWDATFGWICLLCARLFLSNVYLFIFLYLYFYDIQLSNSIITGRPLLFDTKCIFFILACQRFVWFLWVTANFMSLVLWFIYISFALNDNILTIKQLFVWLFSNKPNKLTTIKSFFYHVYQTEGHYWFESLKS